MVTEPTTTTTTTTTIIIKKLRMGNNRVTMENVLVLYC
jgi:hypothetical protein